MSKSSLRTDSKPITAKQQCILEHIIQHLLGHHRMPTLRELALAAGVTIGAIQAYLDALEEKGHLRRTAHSGRVRRLRTTELAGILTWVPVFATTPEGALMERLWTGLASGLQSAPGPVKAIPHLGRTETRTWQAISPGE
jgi:SOS-response transcriptional repressor LexA